MQSYSRIVSPGFCISSDEQTEAKALEQVWEKTKGLVYKPNPPSMVAGIEMPKRPWFLRRLVLHQEVVSPQVGLMNLRQEEEAHPVPEAGHCHHKKRDLA